MTLNELYDLEREAHRTLDVINKEREIENQAFSKGMEKGFDVMFVAVREALKKEGADNA